MQLQFYVGVAEFKQKQPFSLKTKAIVSQTLVNFLIVGTEKPGEHLKNQEIGVQVGVLFHGSLTLLSFLVYFHYWSVPI